MDERADPEDTYDPGEAESEDRSVNVTDGRLFLPMLILSAPIILSYSLDVVYYLVDLYWIGYLGTDAVAAMSYSWPVIFLVISLGFGITTAGTVLIAQSKGAGRTELSDHYAGQTFTFVTLLSLAFAVIGYTLAPTLLDLIGATPGTDPHTLAVQYTRISFLGLTPVFWFFVFDSLSRGWGDTRTPLYLMVLSVGVNMVIDPFFIHGFIDNPLLVWLGQPTLAESLAAMTGFEGWGVPGAAVATVLSRTIAGGIGLYLLYTGSIGISIGVGDLFPRRETVAKIADIGVPTSFEMGLRSSGIAVLTAIIAIEGDAAVAAYGIAEYLAMLVFLPALGLARGTETVVGQNLGAQQVARARRAVYLASGVVLIVLTAVVGLAYPFAESIVSTFLAGGESANAAEEVIRLGAAYVWIVGPAYAVYGVFQVFLGAFRGSGHTRLALVFNGAEMWLFRIPLSVILLVWFDMGVIGVWYAFAVSYLLATVVTISWFLRDTWTVPVVERSTD